MIFSLSAEAVRQSYRVESYNIADSTNNLAAEFAKNGDGGRLWVAAGAQTGGRGRRGRVWQSPRGNLYASLLLEDDLSAEQTANLGFVAGVALREALGALVPPDMQRSVKLKWPNDMLAGGAKLAGILPEFITFSPASAGGIKALRTASVVGIGVNVAAAPAFQSPARDSAESAAPLYPVTCLKALDAQCAAQDVFEALSRAWAENYALWDKGAGMAAICGKWRAHAAFIGGEIHIAQGKQSISGVFETIDESGRLVLARENGGKILISAGDVFFGNAVPGRQPRV